MPFTPKFVDLVRNFTTVQGTGPVVLGASVTGFTSINDALSAGDQFYYCLQSVDKPVEREVGRGTLQADGKVTREAVQGGLTNFSNGTKTIALVAAAEWFSKLELAGGGSGMEAASRAALAARPTSAPLLLTEAGREGVFGFDSGNLSSMVAADIAQGIYVAPASDPTGASGAWVRRFDGPVSLAWFGAVADNATDNLPAINAALNVLALRATPSLSANAYSGAAELRIPPGRYFFSGTIDLKKATYAISGAGNGGGRNSGAATELRFPAGVTGIRVNWYATLGGNYNTTLVKGADYTLIRDLFLRGPSSGSGNFDGVRSHTKVRIENVSTNGFARAGIAIIANATATDSNSGNANGWRIVGGRHEYNRVAGIYIAGEDANSGWCLGADCALNGQFGFYDNSFLGNTYVGCHAEYNGTGTSGFEGTSGNAPSVCSHNGQLYTVKPGQAAACSTNAPSGTTADTVQWAWFSAGTANVAFPAWASGMTFTEGGSYYSQSIVAGNLFLGCYSEGGQSPAKGNQPALAIGGSLSQGVHGSMILLQNSNGRLRSERPLEVAVRSATGTSTSVTGLGGSDEFLRWTNEAGQNWHWSGAGGILKLADGNGDSIGVATTATGGITFGRSANVSGAIYFPKLAIGTSNNARIVDYGSAAPTSGEHAQGEIVFNRAATAAGPVGWICTTAGTPGTWTPISLSGGGGGVSDGDKGDVAVSGSGASWKVESLSGSGGSIDFKTAAADCGFISLYTKASDQSARQGYFGFGAPGSSELSFANEKAGGTIRFTNPGGDLLTLASGGIGFGADLVVTGNDIYSRALRLRAAAGGGTIEFRNTSNVPVATLVCDNAGALAVSGQSFGYASGSGGSVTQATSKSTGVTLNKPCGQVTMHNASLSAGASVSFTLTNDRIGTADTIIANIASGATANAYQVTVDAVAAGSCRIQVRNASGSALGEALALNFAVIKSVAA
jgi:hypothetical protein